MSYGFVIDRILWPMNNAEASKFGWGTGAKIYNALGLAVGVLSTTVSGLDKSAHNEIRADPTPVTPGTADSSARTAARRTTSPPTSSLVVSEWPHL